MPNWCNNIAEFTHPDRQMIDRVCDAYSRGELFSEFFPRPKDLQDGGIACSWSVNNWGTKWDAPGDEKDDPMPSYFTHVSVVTLIFDTAWSPPLEFYKRMTLEFGFKIVADYNESGMCFCGRVDAEGNVDQWSYSDGHKKIPDDVIELWGLDVQ
jgi:hypothetical protein